MTNTALIAALLAIGVTATTVVQAQWQPKNGPLMTRWAKDVSPDSVHPEYPRPQMVREQWLNLNGLWDYAIRPRGEAQPKKFDGEILVPFPVESALSGVMQRVSPEQRLWYRRTFEVPANWSGKRVLLNFGAVDWETDVWVNGEQAGTHRGGYDPFTFDITDALNKNGSQEIVVGVWDPTDAATQPRGKQVRKPRGIWYTPTTGIWQTVWLEPVLESHIRSLRVVPDIDVSTIRVAAQTIGADDGKWRIHAAVRDGEQVLVYGRAPVGQAIEMRIPDAKAWSPENPHLYQLTVSLWQWDVQRDSVGSYFGMRKISVGKDKHGVTRIMLNDKPLFMFGPLDQGFWPDGLYTAPTDEALRYDIEMTRKLGFNLARKHVKIEPDRWYYWCDKLGLLVFQDMPSGDKSPARGEREIERSKESAVQFQRELKGLIDARGNHPSIVMWVPFNEGWGQYDTERLVKWINEYDPTRLVNCASGWNDYPVGDVHDIHSYPGPASPKPEPDRAAVLGEFGGLGLPLTGHTWQAEKNWGYRSFKTAEELTAAYLNLLAILRPMIADPGLSAAVYTQTTDVETEVNGLLTYDRAVIKMDAERVAAANRRLFLPPPAIRTVVPTSQDSGVAWRYTTDQPAADWYEPGFDDSAWPQGPGGFGRDGTPGAVVRTEWHTADIWLRRSFDLGRLPANAHLKLYHDEDCEVYINGKRVASVKGYTVGYMLVALADRAVLEPGRNVMAVHCHQTAGGQGIDAGIVDLVERTGD